MNDSLSPIVLFCSCICLLCSSEARSATLYEKESLYHYILVKEDGVIRNLYFRRTGSEHRESCVDTEDPLRFRMAYYEPMFAAFLFTPEPKRMLFVGLGGGTLPMAIHHYFPEAEMDVVELDPDVINVAKRFFGFKEDKKMRVYARDGRVQMRKFLHEKRKYDIIWLDAFRGGYIPFHLTTKEFYELCEKLLAKGGTLATNLWSTVRVYDYQKRTLSAVFPSQLTFEAGGNAIVIGRQETSPPSAAQLVERAQKLQKMKKFKFDLVEVARGCRFDPDHAVEGDIFTDDYAPANVLRAIPRE